MNVNNIVNEILVDPRILSKPIRDVLTDAQLSLPLIELLNSLPSQLPKPETPLEEFPLEYMYRYISEQTNVKKITVYKEKGAKIKLFMVDKNRPLTYTGDELIDCIRKAFKPYQAEARKELEESRKCWANAISSINQRGL